MFNRPTPILSLPSGYVEVKHFRLTSGSSFWTLQLVGALFSLPGLLLAHVWAQMVYALRPTIPVIEVPFLVLLAGMVGVLLLHEWIHGLAIQWAGYKPRYGAKPTKFVLYATTDEGLFGRRAFIVFALAPLVVITGLCLLLMLFLPEPLLWLAGVCMVINIGGAVGDVWSVWVVLRYAPDALIRDEADSFRIYERL